MHKPATNKPYPKDPALTQEGKRLTEARESGIPWRKWGPYLSERQWGTVREDYSQDGNAWNYFPHDHARSRAYRWGEDGLAGISDERSLLCFALALWNGKDPILKERLFGLTNGEGNHGEDVKEYYFYLDSTPTHSYMKMLYKYPQEAYPYDDLVRTNGGRSLHEPEYELIDTGIFNADRYFDVVVEYAKESPEEILIRIHATNRGPESATLHVLPHLWFRNTWNGGEKKTLPTLQEISSSQLPQRDMHGIAAQHEEIGQRYLYARQAKACLFTNNETNQTRLFGQPNRMPFVKDGINDFIVHGRREAVNPQKVGTKAAVHFELHVPAGQSQCVELRLSAQEPGSAFSPFGKGFDEAFSHRIREADEFYEALALPNASEDAMNIMRQAFAGMLWSKQTYIYDVNRWLKERGADPAKGQISPVRNAQWFHMHHEDVISMPDKWEYPWFAAWDLAFHTVPLTFVDPDFAMDQLDLILQERYLHPNGQIPAYEWNFGDVNPPVHAWATLFNYRISPKARTTEGLAHLETVFQKLMLNFTWWLNRKDRNGRNVFEGGFLGLDNIGVFDRSAQLPTGGYLEQADGTAWMAFFAQNMLDMAIELALHNPVYEQFAIKFYEHFIWIASAMDRIGVHHDEMWDEEDGFFYDVLRLPNGHTTRLKVRSMVGLLPLCAVTVYPEETLKKLPHFVARAKWFMENHPELVRNLFHGKRPGVEGRRMLAIMDEKKIRRILATLLDPQEFLSEYGIRALSRFHLEHPYVFHVGSQEYRVSYLPAESDSGVFGGNSNWRGPIWMPMNVLLIRALLQMYTYFGNDFVIECPTGSGRLMNLYEVAQEISNRLQKIFLKGAEGKRPVFGHVDKFNRDPNWQNLIPFYEYFHGDNGAGIGASHQTGWTGAIAALMQIFGRFDQEAMLKLGTQTLLRKMTTTA